MKNFTKKVVPRTIPGLVHSLLNNPSLMHGGFNTSLADQSQIQRSFDSQWIVKWLHDIVDVTDFYVYPIDGITGAINYWLSTEKRTITMDEGDYEWVQPRTGTEPGVVHYMTSPSSKDGNWREIPTDRPVVLDLAYVGTTKKRHLEIPDNVEKIFYSFSKPFGLQYFRTGWVFSRRRDIPLHNLTIRNGYYNRFAQHVAEHVMSMYDNEYVFRQNYSRQAETCYECGLIPADCVWIGNSEVEDYREFRRTKDGLARICLTSSM